ncbi:MAG: response regulator transcription factor [Bacteroidales bacterium]|jgi:DNA-binding response OmpR family regulator|nr:response regulator transcription factor [Bacteroidales bacterium]
MENKIKLLLVEDNVSLSAITKDYLELNGYKVTTSDNGRDAEKIFDSEHFDLLLLDVMIPYKDGFTLAEDIRKKDLNVPIIFLTARVMHEDRIKGFKVGCDDYILKPFNAEELALRIKSVLKRMQQGRLQFNTEIGKTYQIGGYQFNTKERTLIFGSGKRVLTGKEAALLKLLCERKNGLVMRDEALALIWGENNYFVGRSMDVFITKLRKYLSEDPYVKITNLHGTGFKLEELK